MLLSLGAILIAGLIARSLFFKLDMPPSVGMILIGILIGPSVLNLVDPAFSSASVEFRTIAIVIIFTRAGLNVRLDDLKRNFPNSALICFIPATLEVLAVALISHWLLAFDWIDGLILGTVVAGISPAVTIPNLVMVRKEGYGINKRIPHMMLTGSAMNAAFVLLLFSIFTDLRMNIDVSWLNLFLSIASGIVIGLLCGWIFTRLFPLIQEPINQAILYLGMTFILVWLEGVTPPYFSSLLAVITAAIYFAQADPKASRRLAVQYGDLWALAEIFLFVLAGASLDLSYIPIVLLSTVVLLCGAVAFREIGVWLSLLGSDLNRNEKIFCMYCFIPKAAVQATTGAIPLYLGMEAGKEVQTIAVLAIIITAPIGAWMIRHTFRKNLEYTPPGTVHEVELADG